MTEYIAQAVEDGKCAGVRGVLHEAVDEGVGIQAGMGSRKKDRQHIVADQCSRLTAKHSLTQTISITRDGGTSES